MMTKYVLATLSLCAFLLPAAIAQAASKQVNIALNKPYTMSSKPNYSLTRDAGDKTQLTDGKMITSTKKSFWTHKSAVGWQGRKQVAVTVDLGKDSPISGVAFNSGGGASGVAYPSTIAVLVSSDGKAYHLASDLVKITQNPLPTYGRSGVCLYKTTSLHTHGRYVRFVFGNRSRFIFCDEVEVFKGNPSWIKPPITGPVIDNIKKLANPLRLTQLGVATRVRLNLQQVEQQAAQAGVTSQFQNTFSAITEQLKTNVYPKSLDGFRATLPINNLDRQVFQAYAKVLAASGTAPLVLWHTAPYHRLKPFANPPKQSAPQDLRLFLMNGEKRPTVFNITNTSQAPKTVHLKITGLPDGVNPGYVKVKKVDFVDTHLGRVVAGPLVNITAANGEYTLSIPSGFTQQIWLSFAPMQVKAGRYQGKILVQSEDGEFAKNINLNLHIADLTMPRHLNFSLTTWDYTFQNAYSINPSNQQAVRDFIYQQKVVNTVASSGSIVPVPKASNYDKQGNLIKPINFSKWDQFIAFWPGMKHYYAFTGWRVKKSFCGFKAGTSAFNQAVTQWASAWAKHNKTLGLKPGQVLLAINDEPGTSAKLQTVIDFAKPFRKGTRDILIFNDIHASSISTEAGRKAAQYSDILCPTLAGFSRLSKKQKALYQKLKKQGKQIWLYSCSDGSRQFDASYYRLQPWYALTAGGSGEGFWSFGDGGRTTGWNPYSALGRADYTIAFIGKTSATPSKQWKAMVQGAQDAQYMYMLKQRVSKMKDQGKNSPLMQRGEMILEKLPEKVIKQVHDRAGFYYWSSRGNGSSHFAEMARLKVLRLLDAMAQN